MQNPINYKVRTRARTFSPAPDTRQGYKSTSFAAMQQFGCLRVRVRLGTGGRWRTRHAHTPHPTNALSSCATIKVVALPVK